MMRRLIRPMAWLAAVAPAGVYLLGLSAGCRQAAPDDTAATSQKAAAATPRFADRAQAAGLSYRWEILGESPHNILETVGNGCAFLDYDNDGNLDALLVGPKLALFRGDGKGQFRDVSSSTGMRGLSGHFLGCAVGDYDNDGDPDVYVSGWRTGLLLRNEAGKRFRDVTRTVGLAPQPWGLSCGWADLDGDGFLDLFVTNYVDFGPGTEPQLCSYKSQEHGEVFGSCTPREYKTLKGSLYRNLGGRGFADVTRTWGAHAHNGKGMGVAFAAFDETGRVGMALANDGVPGDLFQNAGKGKLENVGMAAGVAHNPDGRSRAGMGIDWGDYDNDGDFDLFVAAYRDELKGLFRNDGGQFTDVGYASGIGQPTLPYVMFGVKFFDADNDGRLDLLAVNGHVMDTVGKIEDSTFQQPSQLLHNQGGSPATFRDITRRAGPDVARPIVGRGLAVGDYDSDGRVDALVVDSAGAPLLLHNESASAGRGWIGLRLVGGVGENRDAYGAVVTVATADGAKLVRQCQPGGSYLSSSDPRVHFGLGDRAPERVKVTVRWPMGKVEAWDDVPTGRYLTVTEGTPPQ